MRIIQRIIRFIKEVKPLSVLRVLQFNKGPIFIVGCGRSGTTLLLSVLGAHPRIFAIPFETRLYHFFCPSGKKKKDRIKRKKTMLGYLFKEKIPAGKKRFCEKTPRNVHFISDIFLDYGEKARVIHIIRDGRDVVSSKHPKYKGAYVSVDRWVKDVKAGLKYKDHRQVHTVKYEDIISKPQETLSNIMRFLNEYFSEELLEFSKFTNIKKHGAISGEIRPFHSESIGKYKNNKEFQVSNFFKEHEEAWQLLIDLKYI